MDKIRLIIVDPSAFVVCDFQLCY